MKMERKCLVWSHFITGRTYRKKKRKISFLLEESHFRPLLVNRYNYQITPALDAWERVCGSVREKLAALLMTEDMQGEQKKENRGN